MEVADYLEAALFLLNKISLDYIGVSISMEDAATLVLTYGLEGAEDVVNSIASNVDAVREGLGLKHAKHEGKIITMGISYLVDEIIPLCTRSGRPAPQDVAEYFEQNSSSLRRHTGGRL